MHHCICTVARNVETGINIWVVDSEMEFVNDRKIFAE